MFFFDAHTLTVMISLSVTSFLEHVFINKRHKKELLKKDASVKNVELVLDINIYYKNTSVTCAQA